MCSVIDLPYKGRLAWPYKGVGGGLVGGSFGNLVWVVHPTPPPPFPWVWWISCSLGSYTNGCHAKVQSCLCFLL